MRPWELANVCGLNFASFLKTTVMKTAIRLFSYIAMWVILSACSTYQYTILQSNLPLDSSIHPAHYYERNGAVVYFDFYGVGMPAELLIHNDSDEKLYVDLTRTQFYQNGEAMGSGPYPPLIEEGEGKLEVFNKLMPDEVGAEGIGHQVLIVAPQAYFKLSASPFDVDYRAHLPKVYAPQEGSEEVNGLRGVGRHYLRGDGNVFEVKMRMARASDFSDAWIAKGTFQEQVTYQSPNEPKEFPLKSGNVYISERHGKGSSVGYFFLALGFYMVLAMLPDDGQQ